MIVLDTDHISVLPYPEHPRCRWPQSRLQVAGEPLATTVITWEEQLRGWLAEIKRCTRFADQVRAYDRLLKLGDFFVSGGSFPLTFGRLKFASNCANSGSAW